MGLSYDLISEFVKITNDKRKRKAKRRNGLCDDYW